jgi:hypothetical protein
VWQSSFGSIVVNKALRSGKAALREPEQSSLLRLWWKGDSVPFYNTYVNGYVDSTTFRVTPGYAIGQNRQQRSLRSWKSSMVNTNNEYPQFSQVYDILNCGPNNRFTVEGLLVHNCLDFAGNTPRLGPINDPVIPRRRKGGPAGVAPIRICDQCGTYNHASATVCYICGFTFPRQIHIQATAGTDELVRTDVPLVQQFRVDRVLYNKFASNGFDILKVNYVCGIRSFDEIVCHEHPGRAGGMAVQWWKHRMGSDIAPPTVAEALQWTARLAAPRNVWVDVNKKYPKVVKAEF